MTQAEKVVRAIIDEGLGDSSWKDEFPEAFAALSDYREDITDHVRRVLKRKEQLPHRYRSD